MVPGLRAAGALPGRFAAELSRQGYTRNGAVQQLGLVTHLSRWMPGSELKVAALTSAAVEQYAVAPRAGATRTRCRCERSVRR